MTLVDQDRAMDGGPRPQKRRLRSNLVAIGGPEEMAARPRFLVR